MSSRFDEAAGTWDASARRRELAGAIGKAIEAAIALDQDMDLLDVGAGTGLLTGGICARVRSITALDDSGGMIDELREKSRNWSGCRVVPIKADIMTFRTDQRFHGIVSSMTMHHIRDTDAFFVKLASLLEPGGFVAIADLADDDGTFHEHGNEGVCHFGFPREDLDRVARGAGFTGCCWEVVHTIRKEGRGRSYDVFLFTARLEPV
ncbi:MAG: methyltransferase domain-containing protein [Deltaproteobacteria bacterium]|nr:methyltransferase domain-containing protein [Deltaproteobacteria bacterium]